MDEEAVDNACRVPQKQAILRKQRNRSAVGDGGHELVRAAIRRSLFWSRYRRACHMKEGGGEGVRLP